ncbi:ATP-binding protein [Amycolatopsis sp. PS_44_ISF1]|uniref:ATP-binding protein n=1 Tax=Amycolatopsis sp. PS_44_ISF1 TaxID=2974917 RepID=UPI0028DD4CC3|nr:ATP-binding protein [Amycolatopsis sp. PS_44_ISF1]MDT8913794.1 ATP-binding protein [Amycolatopsis sp. PS_44_ISF1]
MAVTDEGAFAPLRCEGVPAEPRALRTLRHRLAAWALAAGIEPELAQDIALAGYEALANVADHAYRNDHGGLVDLRASRQHDRVEVVITDHGRWRPPVTDSAPVSLRGRGLMLLRASADAAEITPGAEGTVVTLGWNLPGPSSR